MKNYRIAFILPPLDDKGGVIPAMTPIIEYMKYLNYEVDIYAIGKSALTTSDNTYIINTQNKNEQFLQFSKLFKHNYNLVIANNLRTHQICIKNNVKNLLCHFHQSSLLYDKGFLKNLIKKYKIKKIYKNQFVSFVSECLHDGILNKYDLVIKKSQIIHNSINKTLLLKKASEELSITNLPAKYIVAVGRFAKNKQFTKLISILPQLPNDVKLVLIGDGEEKGKIQKTITQLKLEQRVVLTGWLTNPYPLIANAKCLISTSNRESFAMTLVEALALQTPVVSFDIQCGPNEILTDSLKKYLLPENNFDEMAKKIAQALVNYPIIEDKYINKFEVQHITKKFLQVMHYYND